jgi:hypothetical protein
LRLCSGASVGLPSVAFRFGRQALDHPVPLFARLAVFASGTKLAGDAEDERDHRHITEMFFGRPQRCDLATGSRTSNTG